MSRETPSTEDCGTLKKKLALAFSDAVPCSLGSTEWGRAGCQVMGTAQDNVGLVITCPWDSQTGNRMKTAIWEEGKMKKAMCGSGGASLLLLSL